MVPEIALVIALFIFVAELRLINTWTGIILPQVISPVCVIVYKQFFDQVLKELREASLIDGASEFKFFLEVYAFKLGNYCTLALVTFIGAWNNFFWPFIMTTKTECIQLQQVCLRLMKTKRNAYMMAVAMAASLPVVLAYIIFQRRITHIMLICIKG